MERSLKRKLLSYDPEATVSCSISGCDWRSRQDDYVAHLSTHSQQVNPAQPSVGQPAKEPISDLRNTLDGLKRLRGVKVSDQRRQQQPEPISSIPLASTSQRVDITEVTPIKTAEEAQRNVLDDLKSLRGLKDSNRKDSTEQSASEISEDIPSVQKKGQPPFPEIPTEQSVSETSEDTPSALDLSQKNKGQLPSPPSTTEIPAMSVEKLREHYSSKLQEKNEKLHSLQSIISDQAITIKEQTEIISKQNVEIALLNLRIEQMSLNQVPSGSGLTSREQEGMNEDGGLDQGRGEEQYENDENQVGDEIEEEQQHEDNEVEDEIEEGEEEESQFRLVERFRYVIGENKLNAILKKCDQPGQMASTLIKTILNETDEWWADSGLTSKGGTNIIPADAVDCVEAYVTRLYPERRRDEEVNRIPVKDRSWSESCPKKIRRDLRRAISGAGNEDSRRSQGLVRVRVPKDEAAPGVAAAPGDVADASSSSNSSRDSVSNSSSNDEAQPQPRRSSRLRNLFNRIRGVRR